MPFTSADRRARLLLAGALAAAGLGLAVAQADAAYTPTIEGRTLVLTGDAAPDKLALRMAATKLPTLEVDVGADGSADFSAPLARLDRVRVLAGAGNDEVRAENLPLPATVEGGDGFDTLAFSGGDGGEQLLLSADGARAKLTRKVSPVAIDAGAVERVDVDPLGGDDTVTLDDLTGTGVQELRADLAAVRGGAAPDAGTDKVILNGSATDDIASVLGGGTGSTFVLGLPTFVTILHGDPARDELTVNTLAGDDRIDASSLASSLHVVEDGGAGDDDLFGSNVADVQLGGDGADFVDGNRGDDLARLGDGNDTFSWQAGDGGDTVEGQEGTDAVQQSGSSANEQFAASAAGQRVRLSRSTAAGSETVDAAGVETLVALSFGGADTVTVGDLTGTGVTLVDASLFDFGVPGGANDAVVADATAAADKITVAPKGSATGAAITGLAAKITVTGLASDLLEIRGLGGDDLIDGTGLPATTRLRADGDAGDDILLGGDGDDVLSGGDGADLVLTGRGDNVAFGGAGDDRLHGEDGEDVLDGGVGFDVLRAGPGDDVLLGGEDVLQD
jgi:Ca2+-binding RTX toxin-like protein